MGVFHAPLLSCPQKRASSSSCANSRHRKKKCWVLAFAVRHIDRSAAARYSDALNVLQDGTVPFWKPVDEPVLALLRRAVREGSPARHSPAPVSAAGRRRWRTRSATPRRCRPGRGTCTSPVGVVRPDAGKAIGLQFDAHLQAVRPRALLPAACCALLHFRQDAEQVLHVMADLVRDHVGLGELAARCRCSRWKRVRMSRKNDVSR